MSADVNYPRSRCSSACSSGHRHGFWASNWRRAKEPGEPRRMGARRADVWHVDHLVSPRRNLYTAYTFVAVPAAMFATGAVAGFFAVPYTIILYPIIFIFMARLWSVSYRHGYVTAATSCVAGLVRGAVAGGRGDRHPRDDAVHRAPARRHPGGPRGRRPRRAVTSSRRTCRCSSRSRCSRPTPIRLVCAPRVIAFVKDTLIYLVIIVAIIYLPSKVGGWAPSSRRRGRR